MNSRIGNRNLAQRSVDSDQRSDGATLLQDVGCLADNHFREGFQRERIDAFGSPGRNFLSD
jgi:hypothetical protein